MQQSAAVPAQGPRSTNYSSVNVGVRCILVPGRSVQSRQLKILILDEHAPSIAVLAIALTSRGYACEAASTAAEAIAYAAQFHPDVVIYEWDLHNDTGRGLARRLRDASGTVMKVIALSARDEPVDFRQSERVDGYVTKPVDLRSLEALLGDRARSRELGAVRRHE